MATATLAQFESGHADMVHDAEFDYYGKRLATCSSDRMIKIFDVVGEQVCSLEIWIAVWSLTFVLKTLLKILQEYYKLILNLLEICRLFTSLISVAMKVQFLK